MRRRGALAFWSYSRANVFAGVSPRFGTIYEASSLPPSKFRLIPNTVDTDRFRPLDLEARRRVRRELGLPVDGSIMLFVGFFSREKGPHRLFEAFARVSAEFPDSRLVFIGATRSSYYEIDPALAGEIKRRAVEAGLEPRVVFVESTTEIQTYYQAADLFVLTSTREGLPVALLEAMSTGLGCIATRLEGITDVLITDGVSGRLVEPGDAEALEEALRFMLAHPAGATEMGRRARAVVLEGYGVHRMVEAYLETYRALTEAGS
jgi:glycosyltransferase involved in cell wall biosynthesis